MTIVGSSPGEARTLGGGDQTANLGDILERVLDKGLVIAGDIRVNLLDIELLTIKLRLVIASLETAKQVGIDWWESDPWLNSRAAQREAERSGHRDELEDLRSRLEALEGGQQEPEPHNRAERLR